MELTYEKIKSIILAVLVVTSVILTWNLWTFQPNVEEFENKTQKVMLSEKKDIKEIVKIDQVFFNINSGIYGTVSSGKIETIMKEISSWELHSFKYYSMDQFDVRDVIEEHDTVQIFYPGEIPIELFTSMYTIDT